jgi:hypothetical protein
MGNQRRTLANRAQAVDGQQNLVLPPRQVRAVSTWSEYIIGGFGVVGSG